MINFFKNQDKDKTNNDKSYSNIAAILIHAAKIDENYEDKEKEIIKRTLVELGAKNLDLEKLIADAEATEKNSNQILNFTKEVKNIPHTNKIKVVESLENESTT